MKRVLFLILVLALIVACGPADQPPASPENSVGEATEVETVQEDEVEANDEEAEVEPAMGEATAVVPSDLQFPATNLAEAMIIRDTDYTLGTEDPLISIIEYGDFQ